MRVRFRTFGLVLSQCFPSCRDTSAGKLYPQSCLLSGSPELHGSTSAVHLNSLGTKLLNRCRTGSTFFRSPAAHHACTETHRPSCTRDQFVPKKQIAGEWPRKGRGEHERGASSEDSDRYSMGSCRAYGRLFDGPWAFAQTRRPNAKNASRIGEIPPTEML